MKPEESITELDDSVRTIMSSILSRTVSAESYLQDVTRLCEQHPSGAEKLIALLDRYQRLGRLSLLETQRVRTRIGHTLGLHHDVASARPGVPNPTGAEPAGEPAAATPRRPAPPASDPPRANTSLRAVPRAGGGDWTVRDRRGVDASSVHLRDDHEDEWAVTQNLAETARPEHSAADARIAEILPPGLLPESASREANPAPSPSADSAAAAPPVPDLSSVPTLTATAPSAGAGATVPAVAPSTGGTSPTAESAPVAPASTEPSPPVASAPSAQTNDTVLCDRYELLSMIGRGGTGSVYKAIDRNRARLGFTDCLVALKLVRSASPRSAGITALAREFQNAQRLSHPNIVKVYDIDRQNDLTFYTMELVDGERLSQLMHRAAGPIPFPYALAIVRDIGAAVAHAHARGIVHADLKPQNVMLTESHEVRVYDFSGTNVRPGEPWISEFAGADAYRPATPAYASCEQLENQGADPRDDIFALACIAYQLFAGRHPFGQVPSVDARAQRLKPKRPAGIPSDTWRALQRGLSFRPEDRTMSVETWLEQLGVSRAAGQLPAMGELLPRSATRPPRRGWRRLIGIAALATLVLVALQYWDIDWPGEAQRLAGWVGAQWQSVRGADVAPAPPVSALTNSTDGARVLLDQRDVRVRGDQSTAQIAVHRAAGTSGEIAFDWWSEGGTATPDVDYGAVGRHTAYLPSGEDETVISIPLLTNPNRPRTSQFRVAISAGQHAADGTESVEWATVTIDQPP